MFTDHQILTYFRNPQKLNRRQARWVTELAQFSFTLKHQPGHLNSKADVLARWADHERGQNDNQDVTVLQETWFWNLEIANINEDLIGKIKSHKKWDQEVMEAIREGKEEWTKKDRLVTWKDWIYIPLNPGLRSEIIRLNHDHPLARHPGRDKTKELIGQDYWWPRMQTDILKYVEGCDKCQRSNIHCKKPSSPLNPNKIPTRPW